MAPIKIKSRIAKKTALDDFKKEIAKMMVEFKQTVDEAAIENKKALAENAIGLNNGLLSVAEVEAKKIVQLSSIQRDSIITNQKESLSVLETAKAVALQVAQNNPTLSLDKEAFIRLEMAVVNSDKNTDAKFLAIEEKFNTRFANIDKGIENITNGTAGSIALCQASIVSHTIEINKLKDWKSWVLGGSAVVGVIIVLLVYIWTTQMTTIKETSKHIETQLLEHITVDKLYGRTN